MELNRNIAVLITCHNRKAKTVACLTALYQCTLPENFTFEVYLVDDGSSDGTAQVVKDNFPAVRIIQGNGKLYWNRGMRLAWETAADTKDYDFYLWLNDDTIFEDYSLNELIRTSFLYFHETIVVGSTSSHVQRENITYGGRNKTGKLIIPGNSPLPCRYFNGNIVLVPNKVFQKTGFIDDKFYHALGDFDYGLRAAKLGVKAYVAPGVLGYCEAHNQLPIWCNPEKNIKDRLKAFRTPLGHNPEEYFMFEFRHFGIFSALFHYFTNHLRLVFPQLWKIKNYIN